MGDTYLITGGAGFIGSHLAEALLARGDRVVVIDDLSTGSIQNIEHLKGNASFDYVIDSIMNRPLTAELVDRADFVFHLAAAVGVKLIIQSPVHTIETNVRGTEIILELANKKKKPVFIASTSEVYGKSAKVPFAEDDDLVLGATSRGRWSYACSKALDEFLAIAYFHEKGLPIVVARLFNTVGPRQTGRYGMVLPSFVSQALASKPITVFGDGTQSRCFGFVGDVVGAIAGLIKREEAYGEVYNIGSQEEISILGLAHLVKERLQSRSEIVLIPYDQAYEAGFEDMPRRAPTLEKSAPSLGSSLGPGFRRSSTWWPNTTVSPSDPVRILLTFTVSVLVAVILTPVARRLARDASLVAKPKADRWHKKPTALMGGPAIVIAAVGTFLLFFGTGGSALIRAWLVGAVMISLVGVYDDIRGLRPSSKLIAQIIAALLPVAFGLTIPVFHPLVAFLIVVFWIVGITNAFNLLDNMDGLAAGIAAIASAILGLHAYQAGDIPLTAAAAAVSGAAIGFLFYNFQPASIFMGDGGSLFLGYSLGTLPLLRMTARPLVSLSIIAVPVFVLAIPIFDTTLVTILRVLHGRPVSQGGRDHSSHRLVSLGLSERRAVTILYVIAASTGLVSLLLPRLPASLVVLCVLLAVLGIYYFGRTLGSVVVYGTNPSGSAEARAQGNFVLDTFVQHKQRIMDVIVDFTIVAISYLSAYLLRYEGVLSPLNLDLILRTFPFLIPIRLLCFFAVGLYRTVPGAFSIHDFLAILKAVLLSSAVFVTALVLFTRFQDFSRAVMVIDGVFTLTGVVFARVALHFLKEVFRGLDKTDRRGVLVVGAGALGDAATRLIEADEKGQYRIVGFLDDSPDKIGRRLHGYMVLGSLREAESVLSAGRVALVVFAASRIPHAERVRLEELCRRLSVDVQEVSVR